MVKSYLRHGPTEVYSLIASATSNSLYSDALAYVPGCEDLLVWDPKKGTIESMWHATGHTAAVTALAKAPPTVGEGGKLFAVGYADGSVRVWREEDKDARVQVVLEGHRRSVISLAWDADGGRLASGASDGEVVVWDVPGEKGLFRLRGHRDQITGLSFASAPAASPSDPSPSTMLPSPHTHLLTTSKDTFMKLWELSTQHCIETVVAHHGGSWGLAIFPPLHTPPAPSDADANAEPAIEDLAVLTAGAEGSASLWRLSSAAMLHGPQPDPSGSGFQRSLSLISHLPLQTPGSAGMKVTNPWVSTYELSGGVRGAVVGCLVGERAVEVWRIRGEDEVKRRKARRGKRKAEKASGAKGKQKSGVAEEGVGEEPGAAEEDEGGWSDRLAPWVVVRPSSGKVRSFSFPLPSAAKPLKKPSALQVLLALNSNALEVYSLPSPSDAKAAPTATLVHAVTLPGHRTDVRCLSVSSDDQLVASGANGSVKVWNVKTGRCVRTLEGGYALCIRWLPGDRHLLVGCKTGEVHLYDLASSSLLETFKAHEGPCWSLDVRPDGRGVVTGGADKDVKFWAFEVRTLPAEEDVEGGAGRRVLTMAHTRTLKMSDDVLVVRYSPDGRLIAISLLDATVKVFFDDTLKFFLSLYGHKLPVLSMDISSDSKLLATCSADKNVKLWGLDFGDCHKSLFAHEESIMQVAFEKGTHLFWTVGKDKMVKYWDGDKFEMIQKLEGHHSEVWALAVSHKGEFVVTAAHDKTLRLWEKTDEPLFLEEERERELEALYAAQDQSLRDLVARREGDPADGGDEVEAVSKQTGETLMAGEKIAEALELAEDDRAAEREYREARARLPPQAAAALQRPARNAVFQASGDVSPEEHVLGVVQKVPRAALEDALLVLPFEKAALLLGHLDYWAVRGWSMSLTVRILGSLVRTHHDQILSTRSLRPTLLSLRANLAGSLERQRDVVGYNLAAIRFAKAAVESDRIAEFYEKGIGAPGTAMATGEEAEAEVRRKIAEGTKKKRKVVIK